MNRKLISIRVEPEVLEWFKRKAPKGYQKLMHSVLKRHVQERREKDLRLAGRAQELFKRYYTQCFWHYDRNLEINEGNLQLVIDGLRKYGGREGFQAASELCH